MDGKLNIADYMSGAIEEIISGVTRATLKNPRESAFMLKFALASKAAEHKRDALERSGKHIPPFLIASITSNCNLFCKGCYAREFETCGSSQSESQMSAVRWNEIFAEAKQLGISFILLAGGEPLLRLDVIEKAAKYKDIIFPIFTNGTMLNDGYLQIFHQNRNLVPILSIEGSKDQTDSRRGDGTYDQLMATMEGLQAKGILFGASVTVTTENIHTVTSKEFINVLHEKGCKVLFYVEYVPVSAGTEHLAPTDTERAFLSDGQDQLRKDYDDMIFISFPGDEKDLGGCLASGRGFFHINANGSAEPCPFSPYSDRNLKECSLLEALDSPLFTNLREMEMLLGEHAGGCLLFEKEQEVKQLLHKAQ